MKARAEMTAEKLRGGFYTPVQLVDLCLLRVDDLRVPDRRLRILEPSVGDGAFVRGLARSSLRDRVDRFIGLEPLDIEAEKARRSLQGSGVPGSVLPASAVSWAAATAEEFDVAVGNPPFVRYQFIGASDRYAALDLGRKIGIELGGVSNLWISVLVGALSRLVAGGVFSFVVPTECFTGVSAGVVRSWILRNFEGVRFDHFAPDSFPGVLQEVGVLSGRRSAMPHGAADLRLVEHDDSLTGTATTHRVPVTNTSWTRYLLSPLALDALLVACSSPTVKPLASSVKFEVSIVTGANDFFTVSDDAVCEHDLGRWARDLLPRIRHAPGLVLTSEDMAVASRCGASTNLLDFSADRTDPLLQPGPRGYLEAGEERGLAGRYKCRIRTPWFRVPGIKNGALLLSKRSHEYPRVVLNDASVFTTDTIYRGDVIAGVGASAVAAAFHNSLTLLTAELEGRSFGGGVLELVPSEIGRLSLPVVPDASDELTTLDQLARVGSSDDLVAATNTLVAPLAGIDADVMATLEAARKEIRDRRFARNRRGPGVGASAGEADNARKAA